ncbi:glycosyl transferase family 2 [Ensifer adhaerens]|nr:glycosyl transferase family 2 [Ensifer adhaerens]
MQSLSKKPMRIGLYYRGMEAKAEHELVRRMLIAIDRIGHQAQICSTSQQISTFSPDLVLSLHSDFPKLTEHLTFGCMWNPPHFFANTPDTLKNIISYDFHLFGGEGIRRYFEDLNFGLKRPLRAGTIYPSCHSTDFRARSFENATAAMVGTNWDGPRFSSMVTELANSGLVSFFGPKGAWQHAGAAYAGSVPFDGTSMLRQLHSCGITIALHRPEHSLVEAPNMRVFEGAAASSSLICDDNPFVRMAFGDSVLYVDSTLPPEFRAEQIKSHIMDIRGNAGRSLERAKAAHEIFLKYYSLEKLLSDVCALATVQPPDGRRARPSLLAREKRVDCIVRTGLRDTSFLERALDSLASQTIAEEIRVVLVNNGNSPAVKDVVKKFSGRLKFVEVVVPSPKSRSHSLWLGLAEVKAEFFCILDDDDRIHATHLESLLGVLNREPSSVVAYSGAIRVEEGLDHEGRVRDHIEERSLAYFEAFDSRRLFKAENFITSNSFLARSNALDEEALVDPELEAVEDLWLLICLAKKGRFVESWEVTSEFYWRRSQADNLSYSPSYFHKGLDRIRTRLQFSSVDASNERITDPLRVDVDLNERPVERTVAFLNSEPRSSDQHAVSDGAIDTVRSYEEYTEIVGWAGWHKRDKRQQLLVAGVKKGELLLHEVVVRPDVARAKKDWGYYQAGFTIRLKIEELSDGQPLSFFFTSEREEPKRIAGSDRLQSILHYAKSRR